MGWRHLPNALTVARLVLVAPITLAVVRQHDGFALGLLLVAGLSDALDGLLARHCRWQSGLGGVLDPVADKVMATCVLLALVVSGRLPWWLFATVFLRDLVIAAGALAYRLLIGPFRAHPSALSKLNNLALLALMALSLLPWADAAALAQGTEGLRLLVVVLVVASGADYVDEWARAARRRPR